MANKNPNEISLMKGVMTKLNDDIVFTLGYFVHTEPHARDKSVYLYLGRIDKLDDIKAEAAEMLKDEHRLENWTWPGLQNFNAVVYDNKITKARGAAWIQTKIKKAVDFDEFVKILDGWKETKKEYNANAKYASEDYVADNGQVINDLRLSHDVLLSLVGHTIIHHNTFKRSADEAAKPTENQPPTENA